MYATSCGMQARALPRKKTFDRTYTCYVCHLHIYSRFLICSHKADTSSQAASLVLCVCSTRLHLCACTSQCSMTTSSGFCMYVLAMVGRGRRIASAGAP